MTRAGCAACGVDLRDYGLDGVEIHERSVPCLSEMTE